MIIKVPIKVLKDGDYWLLLRNVLGGRIIFRAHYIDTVKKILDFDGHPAFEAVARNSVRCKAKIKGYDISDKVLEI